MKKIMMIVLLGFGLVAQAQEEKTVSLNNIMEFTKECYGCSPRYEEKEMKKVHKAFRSKGFKIVEEGQGMYEADFTLNEFKAKCRRRLLDGGYFRPVLEKKKSCHRFYEVTVKLRKTGSEEVIGTGVSVVDADSIFAGMRSLNARAIRALEINQ